MKRDMNLVRAVLLEVEKLPHDYGFHDIEVEGYAPEEVTYHVRLLHEARLIEAIDLSTMSGVSWKSKRLTYQGHEFLDAARSDTVWEKAKSLVVATTGALTLEGVKAALPEVVKKLIGQ